MWSNKTEGELRRVWLFNDSTVFAQKLNRAKAYFQASNFCGMKENLPDVVGFVVVLNK